MAEDPNLGGGFQRFPWEPVKPTFSKNSAILFGVGALVVGALLAGKYAREAQWLEFGLSLTLCVIFALFGFGLVPQGAPRASFRYINATVMTRAEKPTADSWVHVAPTRGARVPMLCAWALAGLFMAATACYAMLVVVGAAQPLNPDTSAGGYLLAFIATAAISVLCLWIAALFIGRRIRNGSFGTRPSGIALGETSVMVNVPGRELEIPWNQIKSVTAERVGPDAARHASRTPLPRRSRGENFDLIRLMLHPGGAITERELLLSARGYTVPTDALYSALRWYHAHPEARAELGRIEGERRIEAWRRLALDQANMAAL